LLHGGIPVDVIAPMIQKSQARAPKFYSHKGSQLSQPIDIIY